MLRDKIYLFLLYGIWGLFIYLIICISLPRNPSSNSIYKYKPIIQFIFPEGWGFFTKNPREERKYFLIKKKGKWIQDPRLRNARLINGWGIIRKGRKVNLLYETMIFNKIAKHNWTKVPDYVFLKKSSFYTSKPVFITISKSDSYLIPREILIIRKKTIPWAFRNFESQSGVNIYYCLVRIRFE